MDALVHCSPPLACYTKAAKTRWLHCSPFVNAKIKHKSLPGTSYSAPLHQALTRLCLDLVVAQEEVLGFLVPWQTIVIVLLVPLCPLILIVTLSNQKINILTGVGHGPFPLVLKILLVGKLIMVTFQIKKWQELQTVFIYVPPIVRIRLKTLVWFYNAINNGISCNLKKSR